MNKKGFLVIEAIFACLVFCLISTIVCCFQWNIKKYQTEAALFSQATKALVQEFFLLKGNTHFPQEREEKVHSHVTLKEEVPKLYFSKKNVPLFTFCEVSIDAEWQSMLQGRSLTVVSGFSKRIVDVK